MEQTRSFAGNAKVMLLALLDDNSSNLDVARAQYQSVRRQAPLLYVMSLICGWGLVATYWQVAPAWATLVYPVLMTVLAVMRIVRLRTSSEAPETLADLNTWRKKTRVAAVVAPAMFAAWALMLFPYGGPLLQAQVAFTVVVMNLVALFCLIHLRSVAVIIAVSSNAIYFSYFLWRGEPEFAYFALFGVLASGVAYFILNNHYHDFVSLVNAGKELKVQKQDLENKQEETQKLSDLNFHIANHDHLTGLPNRRYFFQTLGERFAAFKSKQVQFGLCVFDLGGLKAINDVYGVETGDKIIREVVLRLRERLPGGVFAARLAGDEFAVLTSPDVLNFEGIRSCLVDVFQEPCSLREGDVHLSHYIGYVEPDETAESQAVVLERALYAVQRARLRKNEPAVLFDDRLREQMDRKTLLTNALRTCDMETEMFVVFQPIVDVSYNRIIAVECLARWHSPLVGTVSPVEFIPAAETAGYINRITLTLLAKAMKAAQSWPDDLTLSFNLSATNLSSRGFVIEFLKTLTDNGFDPHRMDCEVTETSVMWDFDEACRAIDVLKSAGIGLSLDDFGTGYSSLSHVHNLPLDCIKVDRSFVSGINPDTPGYGIVKSMLALSRDMGISCVVEGVETEDELEVLKSLGTSRVQGYFYSKPLSESDLGDLLDCGLTHSRTSDQDFAQVS
ncbi:MAG: EAL domain-containing protein [Roseibium sp.]